MNNVIIWYLSFHATQALHILNFFYVIKQINKSLCSQKFFLRTGKTIQSELVRAFRKFSFSRDCKQQFLKMQSTFYTKEQFCAYSYHIRSNVQSLKQEYPACAPFRPFHVHQKRKKICLTRFRLSQGIKKTEKNNTKLFFRDIYVPKIY